MIYHSLINSSLPQQEATQHSPGPLYGPISTVFYEADLLRRKPAAENDWSYPVQETSQTNLANLDD